MVLYRNAKWYNPLFVDVNDKQYEIKGIYAFDETGVVASTSRGWFGGGNNDIDTLDIDCDCKLKRKFDFNSKDAFIISAGGGEAALYIPATKLNLGDKRRFKSCEGMVKTVVKSQTYPDIEFETVDVFSADVSKCRQSIREVIDRMTRAYNITPDQIDAFIADLNAVKATLAAELDTMNANIDAFIKEM